MDVDAPIHILDMPTRAGGDKTNWHHRFLLVVIRIAVLAAGQSVLADQPATPEGATAAGHRFLGDVPTRKCTSRNEGRGRSLLRRVFVVSRWRIQFEHRHVQQYPQLRLKSWFADTHAA